jgi:hypothetical protein
MKMEKEFLRFKTWNDVKIWVRSQVAEPEATAIIETAEQAEPDQYQRQAIFVKDNIEWKGQILKSLSLI